MRYGFVFPGGDPRLAVEMASLADDSGWDGFFVWEAVWGVDAWVVLTAAAMRTSRIRLGTMLTPLPRRRPWDLAGQTATLDNLSAGRVTLSVGLGAIHEGWQAFESDPGRAVRAELLDEGLDVLTGLWRGQPFSYAGKHYTAQPTTFAPPPAPVQQPRIPVWVVGGWPRRRSMRRAARYDGWLPNYLPPTEGSPETLRDGVAWISEFRAAEGLDGPYDVIVEGTTPGDDPSAASAEVRRWADAGATWWLEADWQVKDVASECRARLRAGPPVLV